MEGQKEIHTCVCDLICYFFIIAEQDERISTIPEEGKETVDERKGPLLPSINDAIGFPQSENFEDEEEREGDDTEMAYAPTEDDDGSKKTEDGNFSSAQSLLSSMTDCLLPKLLQTRLVCKG